jgi:hypothetical protein
LNRGREERIIMYGDVPGFKNALDHDWKCQANDGGECNCRRGHNTLKKITIRLLSRRGRRASAIVDAFMTRHSLKSGGCKTFYAPSEWRARKEKYGVDNACLLIVVYDGGDLYSVMSHEFGHGLSDELEGALRAEGFYFEPATNWYCVVYPVPGWKKP